MTRYLWITLAAASLAAAQVPAGLATPTLGYVFDPDAQAVRALEGVPGAAVLGDTLHLDALFSAVNIAPSRNYALGYRQGDSKLALIRLDGRTGVAADSDLPAGRSFFSTSGDAVALISGYHLEVWTGLPNQPSRLRSADIQLDAEVDKAAVSDDGKSVALLSGGVIFRLDESAVQVATGVQDITFLRNSQDLVALASGRLVFYRKALEESAEDLLGIAVEDATSFAMSRDESVVALLSGNTATVVHRNTQEVMAIELTGVNAAGLWRAEGNAVFQLSSALPGRIWLLDADAASPRLVLVEDRTSQEAQ